MEFLLAAQFNETWYLIPLAAVISLVYNASRWEDSRSILQRAARMFAAIMVFMFVVFLILYWLSKDL